MLDGLIDMFSKGLNGLGGLLGGNAAPEMGAHTWAQDFVSPTTSGGLGGSLAGSSLFKDMDLMDFGKLGLGYMGMKEQKKNNKLNRTLTQQNIDENNRITDGREKVAGIFNSTPSLAAGY